MKQPHIIFILIAAIGLATVSCRDELEVPVPDAYVEPGLPATVSLSMDVPGMSVQSRTLTDVQESRINDLWIALYDAEPGSGGKLKNSYYLSSKDEEGEHQLRELRIENLRTTSGRCYLVAAANVANNYGVSSDSRLWNGDDDNHPSLLSMLEKADNLDRFKSIAAAIESTLQTDYSSANLVMGGAYLYNSDTSDGDIQHKPDYDWTQLPVVTIPAGEVKLLSGKLHLRRLVSKVSFKINAGAGITVRPTQWRVINNPRFCYIQEQNGNAGDAVTVHLSAGDNSNYGASDPETEIEHVAADGSYRFTFYTYENKRTARSEANVTGYHDREKEYKTESVAGPGDELHHSNTGVYTALCADARTPDLKTGVNVDNFATIVEITCDVQYETTVNGQKVQRTGTAIYTVHLGYMKDNTGRNDPTDFNVRRNYKYNYTMTVLGLNQIVLEAQGEESYPGLEGTVIDATAEIITVDAHYGAFNIQLSNEERANLRYLIEAPYGADVKTYDSGHSSNPDTKNEYYNWIRIKPTTRENVLAEYKTSASDEPWYLEDLIEKNGNNLVHSGLTQLGTNASASVTDNTQLWYTVFINENVYDKDGMDRHPLSDWVNYVNKDMRTVLFLVQNINVSTDEESRYGRGKYMFRQRSIQTYYTTDVSAYKDETGKAIDPTALGVEHVNESYGKRIDWRWSANNTNLNLDNGRWNQWQFLCNSGNTINDPGNQAEATRRWYYSNIGSPSSTDSFGLIRYVYGATGINATSRTGYMKADEDGYAVPALVYYSSTDETRENDPTGAVTGYYEAMTLCMNRNRDLDGDGQISPDEVRWYLPAEGKYERIMLGRNSLVTPIFAVSAGNYYCNPNDPIAMANNNFGYDGSLGSYGVNNALNYVASNHMKFYAEEGGSYQTNLSIHWAGGNEGKGRYPWNVRCVRNLGVDLSSVISTDPVGKAYEVTKENGYIVFNQRYYYGRSVRSAVIDDYIPVHTVADMDKNRVAKKFMVAKDNEPVTIGPYEKYKTFEDALNDNYPCSNVTDGGKVWRAPNQRELMMMLNEKILGGNGNTYSCTKDAYPEGERFSSTDGSQIIMSNANETNGSSQKTHDVRCVRDIE